MSLVKNIIFDLGGVILNIDNRITEREFVTLGATDFGRYFGHGFAASFFKDYEVGKISSEQFISDLKKIIGVNLPDPIVVKAWNALLLDFPPERIALLERLKNQFRIFLFSNTNALHLEALYKIYSDTFSNGFLDDHFEKAYYSHIIGLRKPEIESYRYIIDENQLDAAETLFVDDAMVNVEGARAAGLQGFFLGPGKTITGIDWEEFI